MKTNRPLATAYSRWISPNNMASIFSQFPIIMYCKIYNMDPLHKRFLLFLVGCIGTRTAFAFIAKTISLDYLPILGYIAILPMLGFLYIFATGSRKTGIEVGGGKIWWNFLRPVHALMYFLFAYNAISGNRNAWYYLAADVIIGLVAFLVHHGMAGHLKK